MPLLEFFYDNKWMGEGRYALWQAKEQLYRPTSEAYVCHRCGQLYARIVVEGAEWTAHKATCWRCPPPDTHTEVPGSILTLWNLGNILPALSDAALVKEFHLHLNFYGA